MRLFTAVSLDEGTCQTLARAVERVAAAPGAPRWTEQRLWHVTLVFLGEVDGLLVPRLYQELEDAAAAIPPFTLRVSGAGAFPPSGSPSILWAGLDGELQRLSSLARAVRRAARQSRLPVERRQFHPHVTLGRWRSGGRSRSRSSPAAGAESGPATGSGGAPSQGTPRAVVAALDEALSAQTSPMFEVSGYSLLRSHPPTQPGEQPHYEPLATWHLRAP